MMHAAYMPIETLDRNVLGIDTHLEWFYWPVFIAA